MLGNYKLLELIGHGGMGYVYLAEHIKLGRQVALKLLRDTHAERRDAVARFFQEARAVNKIRHRNIVDVTDFVELDDGTTFIIMEFLAGSSLGKLARTGELPWPRALALLIQICDGLAAAHRNGIVHRDLKPDNIIVLPTGDGADLIKLLDFGVAKLLYSENEDLGYETAAGAVVGTPTFMSPEQAGGLDVDARADIYSLGAIMYEVFCGQPVFTGRSFGEFVRKHLNELPVRPSQTPGGRHIDDRLEAIILRCLEKRPDDRYPGVLILRDELLRLLGAIETSISSSSHSLVDSGSYPPPAAASIFPSYPFDSSGSNPRASSHGGSDLRPGSASSHGGSDLRPGSASNRDSGDQRSGSSGGRHSDSADFHSAKAIRSSALPSQSTAQTTSQTSGLRAKRQSDVDSILGVPEWPQQTAMAVGDLPTTSNPPKPRGRATALIFGGIALGAAAIVALFFILQPPQVQPAKPPISPNTGPTVEPLALPMDPSGEPSTRPIAPANGSIILRFRSTPSGAVYAVGSTGKLCRTPCDLTVNPNDGASATRRDFTIKRTGYRSEAIAIDLEKLPPNGLIEVSLRPNRDTAPPQAEPPPATVEKAETKPTDTKPPDTVEPELYPKPTGGKIDPTDTMDPFGRR